MAITRVALFWLALLSARVAIGGVVVTPTPTVVASPTVEGP
jgi:hypothetical protein